MPDAKIITITLPEAACTIVLQTPVGGGSGAGAFGIGSVLQPARAAQALAVSKSTTSTGETRMCSVLLVTAPSEKWV